MTKGRPAYFFLHIGKRNPLVLLSLRWHQPSKAASSPRGRIFFRFFFFARAT
jgi:hypothetical protein